MNLNLKILIRSLAKMFWVKERRYPAWRKTTLQIKDPRNFETKKELNFDLLADEDHAIAEAFGVWGYKKFMGKEYDGIHRLTFLVGQDGKIKHLFDKFKTKDHHQVVLDYLAAE